MRNLIIIILITSLVIIGFITPLRAEMATMDEAQTVAENWISLIIANKGSWGGSETAEIQEIREFKRGYRTIGFFCKIRPKGFIVISLRKELAPVKAYSAVSDLNPELEEGMADLIKSKMERILNGIEQQLGPLEAVQTEALQSLLEINYRQAWDELLGTNGRSIMGDQAVIQMNYQEADVLLTSSWHQRDPYNRQTPAGSTCTHTLVGCVATAGAQIMRYWNWPPYGAGSPYSDTYDWPNMLDRVTSSSSTAEINAVAELNYEVGLAVGMNYGCSKSTAYTYDMEGVYENNYRYTTAITKKDRNNYNATDWFNRLKTQFNANRPVHYRVEGHSIVGDGWQEIGSTPTRQYHMNYGWDNSYTAWYTLDALYLGGVDEEYILENIYPAQALGSWLSGTYSQQSFPYRYFDRDATGYSATFSSGQYLQFLPNITVTNTSNTGGSFRFEGSDTLNTRLFTRGDTSQGVRIYNGTIKINKNGSIKFY